MYMGYMWYIENIHILFVANVYVGIDGLQYDTMTILHNWGTGKTNGIYSGVYNGQIMGYMSLYIYIYK